MSDELHDFQAAVSARRVVDRAAAEIKKPSVTFYGIMGREKGKGKMKPFDYEAGRFVSNVIHQTMWPDKGYVQGLVNQMNKQNPDYEFEVKKRS